METIDVARCGDCGRAALGATMRELGDRGWKIARPRDGYGNPVLRWRCPSCAAEAVHTWVSLPLRKAASSS